MRNRYAFWKGKFIRAAVGITLRAGCYFSVIPSVGNLGMQFEDNTDSSLAAKLAEADGQMRELNACVDRQCQLITNLADAGSDIASAQVVLDSLLIRIFCG
jgi:hypothetical protein